MVNQLINKYLNDENLPKADKAIVRFIIFVKTSKTLNYEVVSIFHSFFKYLSKFRNGSVVRFFENLQ